MKWLNKLNELIETEFKSVWKDDLISINPDDLKKNIEIKEKELIPKVYEFLNLSVLEGEYIKDFACFDEIINSIHSKISNLQNSIITVDDPDYKYTIIFDDYQFFYSVNKSLVFYKRIAVNIEKQLNNPEKTFVLDFSGAFEDLGSYLKKKENDLEESLFDLFYENLFIARRGFFITDSTDEFSNLLDRINILNNLKSKIRIDNYLFESIIDILIEICVFYQRKLIIRKSQDSGSIDEKYLYELKEIDFRLEDHNLKNEYFKRWDEYSQDHYLSEKNKEKKNKLKRDFENLLKDTNDTLSFISAHKGIKYYKDINPNIEKIQNYNIYFEKFISKSKFDNFALNVSHGYLLNNIISKKLENLKYNGLKTVLSEIVTFQEKCNVNNFFPYYKVCKFLKSNIEDEFTQIKNGEIESLVTAKQKIKELKELFKTYKIKLNWSKKHLTFAYQTPFEECLSKVDLIKDSEEFSLNLFIPSTFSLPLNFSKYDKFLIKLDNYLLFCENELKSLENYYFLNTKILEKEKEISDILKDQAKKNIELLGIFSAIIALLFQGAYTVNSKVSYEDKLFTLIAMFLVLVSFLLMLRSFYSKKFERDELITIKIVSFLIIPILLITTFILFKIYK